MTLTKAELDKLRENPHDIEIDVSGEGDFTIRLGGVDISEAVSRVTFDFEEGQMDIDWKLLWVAAQGLLETFK